MKVRRPPAWWIALVAAGTLAASVPLLRWADSEIRRTYPNGGYALDPTISRPDWIWDLRFPFERLMHEVSFVVGILTLGMALLLASAGRFRPRRGRLGPGALQVLVIVSLGGFVTAHILLAGPSYFWMGGTTTGLSSLWNYTLPGFVIGTWVVGRRGGRRWRRDPLDRAARIVPWLWLIHPLLLAAHGLLFG